MDNRGETFVPASGADAGAAQREAAARAAEREAAARAAEREAATRAEREAAARSAAHRAQQAPPREGETRPVSDRAGTHDENPEDLRDLRRLRTRDLVTEIARKASALARREIDLAKAEAKEDLRAEVKMASALGVAGVCALLVVETLLVAIAFALQESGVLPGWLASLIIAAVVLAIGTVAGLWGWAKRVRTPLDTTRRSIQENVRWAKDRIA